MSTAPGLIPSAYFTAYEAARRIYHAPGRAAFGLRLEKVSVDLARDKVRLNYGRIEAAADERIIIGGNVKLRHLRERFDEHFSGFNLLYLVSSAPLPYWEDLVRWAKRRGCKLVWNQNGVAYRSWCGDYYPWFNAPLRQQLQQADYVVYQSDFCRVCADRYLGVASAPSRILFNPVDLEHFCPAETALPAEPWQLLAAGTSHHFYRVKSALDCLAALREDGCHAVLTIAGEFRWKNGEREVAEYLRERKLEQSVRFQPPFTQAEAPGIYRRAHVLIHPKYKDPCPTVPIEAMACGVPVIGSRSGGMPELVPQDCGVLVPVKDDWDADIEPEPRAMAEGVKKIFADHAGFSRAARAHASAAFDKRRWVDAHAEIFREVLHS